MLNYKINYKIIKHNFLKCTFQTPCIYIYKVSKMFEKLLIINLNEKSFQTFFNN